MHPARTPRRRLPMTLALLLVATGLAACAVGTRFETKQFAGAFYTLAGIPQVRSLDGVERDSKSFG